VIARDAARAIAFARVGIGVLIAVAPGRALRAWVGADADRTGAQVIARGLGARDFALGAGGLLALQTGDPARRWVLAGAVADAGDALAMLRAGSDIPTAQRAGFVAFAGGAAAAGAALARSMV
jgi:hypothetical protein